MDKPICLGSTDLFQHAPFIFIVDQDGELVAIDRQGQIVECIKEPDLPHQPHEVVAFSGLAQCWITCTVNGVTKRYRVPCP